MLDAAGNLYIPDNSDLRVRTGDINGTYYYYWWNRSCK